MASARLIATSITLSLSCMFCYFNSRKKRSSKKFPGCVEGARAVLLVSELPHSEGHFSPCLCFSGSFAMLGYKGQAKPSWIKVLNHASYQKAASLQHYVPLNLKEYQCPANAVESLKFAFSQTCLEHMPAKAGAPGVSTAGEHQPGRAQHHHHQNLLFLRDCTKPMVFTCAFYNQ